MRIGYARVSTEDQNLALQLDALQAEGCGQVLAWCMDQACGRIDPNPVQGQAMRT